MDIYSEFRSLAANYAQMTGLINSKGGLFLDLLNRCIELGVPRVLEELTVSNKEGSSIPVFYELLKYYNGIFPGLDASAKYSEYTNRILTALEEIDRDPSFRISSPEYSFLVDTLSDNMKALSKLRQGLILIRDEMTISVPNAPADLPVLTYNSFVYRNDIPAVCYLDFKEGSLSLGPSFDLEKFLQVLPYQKTDQGEQIFTVFDILDALIFDLMGIENTYLSILNRLVNYTIYLS